MTWHKYLCMSHCRAFFLYLHTFELSIVNHDVTVATHCRVLDCRALLIYWLFSPKGHEERLGLGTLRVEGTGSERVKYDYNIRHVVKPISISFWGQRKIIQVSHSPVLFESKETYWVLASPNKLVYFGEGSMFWLMLYYSCCSVRHSAATL